MIPAAFSYHQATSVDDAVARLVANPDAKILAGGHSLVPAMKLRLAAPGELVDISRLNELKTIHVGDTIEIGALVTYKQLRDHDLVRSTAPILAEAIDHLGDRQVRARGTIGGSIAHADPAADLTAVFLALGGQVHTIGPDGERSIPIEEYFVDLWTTALEPEEIVTRISVPVPSADARMTYIKHRHPASGYAVVGIAVIADKTGVRATITGATSKPEHLIGVEHACAHGVDSSAIARAVEHASDDLVVHGDLYADEEYRRHLIGHMVKQALEAIA